MNKNNIMCFLGFHKEIKNREIMFKTQNIETVNISVKCKYCGKLIESYGFTHFGTVCITNNNIKLKDLD